MTLPSGRVPCYWALSTGATRGSGLAPGTGPASRGHLLSSQLHLHTASHHLVTLTPSSQLILSPWATFDFPLCSPAKALWEQPCLLLGTALPSPGNLRALCPSPPSALFPEGKYFSFVQIQKGAPSDQTSLLGRSTPGQTVWSRKRCPFLPSRRSSKLWCPTQ